MKPGYMTIEEVADYLQISEESLYKYARRGIIPAAKVGRHWRFEKHAIDEWMAVNMSGTQPTKQSSSTSRKLRVLIADDDSALRKLMCRWVDILGHETEVARDGTEALEMIMAAEYDLVLMDLQMPGLNGAQVLARLKEYEVQPPVVLITGYADSEMMDRAMDYDLLYSMSKPVDRKELVKLIESIAHSPAHERHEQEPSRMDEHANL